MGRYNPHLALLTSNVRPDHIWESQELEGLVMEFRLTYEGELLASGTDPRQENRPARVADKHRIRRVFHKQLKKLWYTNPNLIPRTMFDAESTFIGSITNDPLVKTYPNVIERTAANHTLGPFRFAPLVTKTNGLNCKLEILMLRPSLPGGLLNNSDIDNRLKTLFDTLQKPGEMAQIGNETPQNGEDLSLCWCKMTA